MNILDKINTREDLCNLNENQLDELCSDIRDFLVNSIAVTGGHLASNLGVVELTVVIHRLFDLSCDRLIFDVGHQSYVHKILTGRKSAFPGLRSFGGISGFPKPSESDTDAFIAGHASSSISVALGMARARTITGSSHKVLCLTGDGALTGGLSFEALNDAGQSGEDIIVILNDNGMSIKKNVGGIASALAVQRVKPAYYTFKKAYRKLLFSIPGGKVLYRVNHSIKTAVKHAIFNCSIFEDLGFKYLGPVDGHDIKKLEYFLGVAKKEKGPVLIHVVTRKGYGYPLAQNNPDLYHGVPPFNPKIGVNHKTKACFSSVFGQTVLQLAEQDPRICAITAAMESGTGLSDFADKFSERFFDVGIAEGHAVSMAGGMAKQGLIPIFAVYSSFLQRSYDMLIHDIALLGLHAVFAVDRAGLVGEDGETHHGVFDVGYLSQIPGMTVWAPASYAELRDMLSLAVKTQGPAAVRYPRGKQGAYTDGGAHTSVVLRKGTDVTLVGYGILINNIIEAAELLTQKGYTATVIKLGMISPPDMTDILVSADETGAVAVIEEVVRGGCVGERISAELLSSGKRPKLLLKNLGDSFVPHGRIDELIHALELDAEGICRSVYEDLLGGGV
ncbi:MAG: 1-deoxy-D-xylulose-5-phosphate synthase [Clostridiales bacterium]|nr:1-deoxy-D-xylulose-5-phosphate synthase [Clostridiales bacterium]